MYVSVEIFSPPGGGSPESPAGELRAKRPVPDSTSAEHSGQDKSTTGQRDKINK